MLLQCTRLKTKASYTKLHNIPPKIKLNQLMSLQQNPTIPFLEPIYSTPSFGMPVTTMLWEGAVECMSRDYPRHQALLPAFQCCMLKDG